MEEFSTHHLQGHVFGTTVVNTNKRTSSSSSSSKLLQPSYYHTTTATAATPSSSSSSVAPLIIYSSQNTTATDHHYSNNINDLYHHHHHHQQQQHLQNNISACNHQPKSEEHHHHNTRNNVGDHVEEMKAKIIAHPHYSNLLSAYMDCQEIGAPPEVAERLKAACAEFESRQRNSLMSSTSIHSDPELDQFMDAYYQMLVKYKDELTKPIQEAMDFLKRVESQLNSITDGSSTPFLLSSDTNCGTCSSDEDLEGSGGETDQHTEIDPRAEERELKHLLLKKYSGYLGSLRQELSKKKKKGKLPKEARQKLLNWWEMHYKWPYPSEAEKVALAESTGLDQKQINNWFINQRKRHWKPSEEMQFVVENYYPQHPTPFYIDGPFLGNGTFRFGP